MGSCNSCSGYERITVSNMDLIRCRTDLDYCIECAHVYFRVLDSDFDGKVTFDEFTARQQIKDYPMAKLRRSFENLDRNRSGFIDEFEFSISFIEKYWSKHNNNKPLDIKDIIDRYRLETDEQYCYRISRNMFCHLMRNINHKFVNCHDFKSFYRSWLDNPSEEVVNTIFRNADIDNSKSIDQNEFVYAFMTEHYWKQDVERKKEVDYMMKTRMHTVNQFYQSQYCVGRYRSNFSGATSTSNLTNRIRTKDGEISRDSTFYMEKAKFLGTSDSFFSKKDVVSSLGMRKEIVEEKIEDTIPDLK